MDCVLRNQYFIFCTSENRLGTIFIAFTIFAIFIACLGLFALTGYATEQRTKEIGIRKVLGANALTIVRLVTDNFMMPVFIAILAGPPLAWLVMNKWLQAFAYRTTTEWWMVAVAGLAAIAIALMAVSFQSIRASLANPAKSLTTQ